MMEHNTWKDCYIKLCVTNITKQNYKESIRTGIVQKGLRIKKALAFEHVSKYFYIK